MQKNTKILIGTIIIAVGLITIFILRLSSPEDIWLCQNGLWIKHGAPSSPAPTTKCGDSLIPTATSTDENQGIAIFSPKQNEKIKSPLTITGQVTGENNWIGFEGQVGTVKLLDGDNNIIASSILNATSDWMQFPINFQAVLNFDTSKIIGFDEKTSKKTRLIFYNENPSGDPIRDQIYDLLPIKIISNHK